MIDIYYVKHKRGEKTAISRRVMFTISLAMMIFLIFALSSQIRRIASDAAHTQASNIYSAAVSEALSEVIQEESFDIIHIDTDSTGEVNSLVTDTGQLNRLQAELAEKLIGELQQMEAEPLYLSAGTLTGIDLLAGFGPEIEFRMQLRSGVRVDVHSEIIEAGINQSLHRIVCTASADYYLVMPGYKFKTTLSRSIPLAESVIVGDVPEAYTYVTGDKSDTVGRIFDYGAEYQP